MNTVTRHGDAGHGAVFSPCMMYRYRLWRTWDVALPYLVVVGLNPSTADESVDDATIRKVRGFAQHLGYGSFAMLNLFAFRATNPRNLPRASDPVGAENDMFLHTAASSQGDILFAWGRHGTMNERDVYVAQMVTARRAELGMKPPLCLQINKDGTPAHLLYLPYTTPLRGYDLSGRRGV